MTTEENLHNEEVIRATQLWECGDITREQLEYIFPKLKESEDEKIRKALIRFHKSTIDVDGIKGEDIITWLEKQGKDKEYTFKSIPRLLDMIEPSVKAKFYCQNLIDTLIKEGYNTDAKIVGECLKGMDGEKVAMATMDEKKQSPKFKVGDWVVDEEDNHVYQVRCVLGSTWSGMFGYDLSDNGYFNPSKTDCHLWSIADAKDGDVLVCCDNKPFIFKGFFGLNFPNCLAAYCGITLENQFRHCNGKTFWTNQDVKPATKEQRKLLFEKMAEAGYGWDDKKKELKITAFSKHLKYNPEAPSIIEQKPVWSEEDEYIMEEIEAIIDAYVLEENDPKALKNWLKSIEKRVQPQPRQDSKWKWDEDDEKFFKENILLGIGNAHDVGEELYGKIIDWVNLIKKRLS